MDHMNSLWTECERRIDQRNEQLHKDIEQQRENIYRITDFTKNNLEMEYTRELNNMRTHIQEENRVHRTATMQHFEGKMA